jgi:hypothetical protein
MKIQSQSTQRGLCMFAFATATWCLTGAPVVAASEAEAMHDGKIVSITAQELVMTNSQGQEHTHTLSSDVKLILDGKACKVADLKAGTKIRVTTVSADKKTVNRVEGIDKNQEFATNYRDGKVISLTGTQLVMSCDDGQEHSQTLTTDAKLTLDGKVCKASDLKAGTRIRVTTLSTDKGACCRIEGLDVNQDFASL